MQEFGFHPLIADWFVQRFAQPTEPQRRGWPVIARGGHTLIAAPTGSGKTLTAFLAVIDRLFREAEAGTLENEIRVVYLSPLRALSNDMQKNLSEPLAQIAAHAEQAGLTVPPIRVGLRTGDTSASQRAALLRKPPHVLVTTPESLYLLLTTDKGREALRSVRTVIVDEIHALVRDKRGSHMALSLERLEALADGPIQRIGLSATQKPLSRIAEFLVGVRGEEIAKPPARGEGAGKQLELWGEREEENGEEECASGECAIVDVGHQRYLDLSVDVPVEEIGPVCTHEQWAEVHQRLGQLIESHRSTLIFVNTRRMAERLTHQLSGLLGEEHVSSHHGSLSAEIRLSTEQRLKSGQLKAVVATASLELGIDVGYIDLVIQLGSPRSIATFLQRIGRSGHSLHAIPKGRIIPLTRDELLECMALIRAINQGILDEIRIPEAPLDVLVQQLVAETTCEEWNADELFALCRRAWPYRQLTRDVFEQTLQFLSEGLTERSGRTKTLVYYDRVGQRIKARPAAKSVAVGNAGAIPENATYRVVAEPEHTVIGTVDEEFAVESMRGDVFQLGNTSWQINFVRQGDVIVHDAHGAPPTIPFWQGEGLGRTIELSTALSDLRAEIQRRSVDRAAAIEWVIAETTCPEALAGSLIDYIRSQEAAIGVVPVQEKIVFERFFDETGGMQLVVHAPFGMPITKAWGFAMRKRFCRSFDFELQATADDDGFILSLGPQHSFPIESLFGMLTSENVQGLLEQAIIVQPPFQLRWRWNVTRALLVQKMKFGKKVPPPLQRFRSEDLLTSVFPQLTGCLENHTGDIEPPDHPLVNQTMHDCLHEAMDIEGLKRVLRRIEAGEIQLIARDTREPSPFCYELLNSAPYTFLDGGEVQERRARVVAPGSDITPDMPPLDWLDPLAIEQVVSEAAPLIRNRDELHDFLLTVGVVAIESSELRVESSEQETDTASLIPGPQPLAFLSALDSQLSTLNDLLTERRAFSITLPDGRSAWIAVERFGGIQAIWPESILPEGFHVPGGVRTEWDAVSARMFVARGWLEICGPVTATELARHLNWSESQTAAILEALEGEGIVMRVGQRGRVSSVECRVKENAETPSTIAPSLALSTQHSALGTSSDSQPSWCHRRLLARIHRRTLAGLRQQVEPMDVAAFQRFLFEYHGLIGEQRSGVSGLYEVLSQLQGLDLSAAAWESDLLSSRLKDYDSAWLDELCLTGEAGWGRMYPPKLSGDRTGVTMTRAVPLSLYLRADLPWLVRKPEEVARPASPKGVFDRRQKMPHPLQTQGVPSASPDLSESTESLPVPEGLSSLAAEIHEYLTEHGASFANDLLMSTRMLPTHLEETLGELISRGLVTSDTFAGLRSLIAEKKDALGRSSRSSPPGLARKRVLVAVSGRWSIWRRPQTPAEDLKEADRLLAWAWQLIRRWGVVFRDLLAQEDGAPRWWELAPVFRRLEARGELRGGRFITGVAGEQFALESTISQLRRHQDVKPEAEVVCINAVDPLNLVGVLTPPPRIPSQAGNRVAYLKGIPAAALQAGEVVWLITVSAVDKQRLVAALYGWEMPEIDDPHLPRRRKTKPSPAKYPNQPPRPLIS